MVTTHNLGFPRIGAKRELKFALESFWQGQSTAEDLFEAGKALRHMHWRQQESLDYASVGDFSFYDHVLDMSFLLGNIPERLQNLTGSELDNYFRAARGRSVGDSSANEVAAAEMTKWFDTNYHYIVPEFTCDTIFELNPERLLQQIIEAQRADITTKPVIIGPVTYLWLGKARDGSNKLELLKRLLPIYSRLFEVLAEHDVQWVQVDEPILVTELDADWKHALELAYNYFNSVEVNILLTSYFGKLQDNLQLACNLPVAGLHIDAINARDEIDKVLDWLPKHKVLSLGLVNGRNIWKTDLNATLDWLEPIYRLRKQTLWIAPSCSLLHVPVDLNNEGSINPTIKSWLAFAAQKLDELFVLSMALKYGRESVEKGLLDNSQAMSSRYNSTLVHNDKVKMRLHEVHSKLGRRFSPYYIRATKQREALQLPLFPTTTIGSFPQTPKIRQARSQLRHGLLDQQGYERVMQQEIEYCIQQQEKLGLDVLVHGEAERNDMVEYFGEQLEGYVFSQYGWVQSYGSRCVKPPILFGDIQRSHTMTVKWTKYAQSLTKKFVKGMLTGPVTMLNWSFVRDDQPRSITCRQLALAMRDEVLDLENAGVNIIQIDEPALREGLPLRRSEWQSYLNWAVESFRITANGVQDTTQIHTHMCYSEFNDIIKSIAQLDADVITIETSRSNMELLEAFEHFNYPNEIGPGVYDIHSPNIPKQQQMVHLMRQAAAQIPAYRLWVNPDCGLKTRKWDEVIPSLKNMVSAARTLRAEHMKMVSNN